MLMIGMFVTIKDPIVATVRISWRESDYDLKKGNDQNQSLDLGPDLVLGLALDEGELLYEQGPGVLEHVALAVRQVLVAS